MFYYALRMFLINTYLFQLSFVTISALGTVWTLRLLVIYRPMEEEGEGHRWWWVPTPPDSIGSLSVS